MSDEGSHEEYMNKPNFEQSSNSLGPCDRCGNYIDEEQKHVRVDFEINVGGVGMSDPEETDEVYHSDCYMEMLE